MTSAVLNATQRDLTDNTVYFDDFVGDGDLDLRNHPKVGGALLLCSYILNDSVIKKKKNIYA